MVDDVRACGGPPTFGAPAEKPFGPLPQRYAVLECIAKAVEVIGDAPEIGQCLSPENVLGMKVRDEPLYEPRDSWLDQDTMTMYILVYA